MAPVTRQHELQPGEWALTTEQISTRLISNPLDARQPETTPPPPTTTLGARTVYQEAQAALRPLLSGVQTQEQLDTLVERLGGIR